MKLRRPRPRSPERKRPPVIICHRCRVPKKRVEFHRKRRGIRGRRRICKDCSKDLQYQRRYGITRAEVLQILFRQRGRCAGCHTPIQEVPTATFAVDHNHATGEIRGLLCFACNKVLGAVQDNPETLQRLSDYLQKEPYSPQQPLFPTSKVQAP